MLYFVIEMNLTIPDYNQVRTVIMVDAEQSLTPLASQRRMHSVERRRCQSGGSIRVMNQNYRDVLLVQVRRDVTVSQGAVVRKEDTHLLK